MRPISAAASWTGRAVPRTPGKWGSCDELLPPRGAGHAKAQEAIPSGVTERRIQIELEAENLKEAGMLLQDEASELEDDVADEEWMEERADAMGLNDD